MAVHPIALSLSHLRKVGCFPAVSAHLRKVGFHRSACECPQNCCSAVLHFPLTCAPLEGEPFCRRFYSPSEGEELQHAHERCLWPYIPSHCPSPTFGRWAAFRLFPLTFGRWDFIGLLANALRTVVARFCIFTIPAHLWKVGCFAVVSTHLRKVSNCSMSARGTCGRTSHRIVPFPPSEGGLFSGCFRSPSEGGRGGRAPFPVSEFF